MDDELLAANQAFYDAFRHEDVDAMEALWAERAPVACIHPGWAALTGRAEVLESWRAIISAGAPAIRCAAARAHLLGEAGFVVCDELIAGGRLVATNIFVREDGRWRMVHHQAGPIAGGTPDEDADEPDEGDDDDDDVPGPMN